MRFPSPLIRGRLLRRYKRFLADVELPGAAGDGPVTAHCPNPGSMLGLAEPGQDVWLAPATNPKAKLAWRWELSDAGGALVVVNTARANELAAEALAARSIPELAGAAAIRREVAYGAASRIDFLLQGEDRRQTFVEVKSVTLRRPDGAHPTAAEFPDAVTKRGAKHLDELVRVAATGDRAVMLYLVQRADCDHFRVAADIDPVYAAAFKRARAAGVEALCYGARVTPDRVEIGPALPVV